MPSPSISLNLITNESGFRPGSIIEWYGLEGTVKTTIALEMCREAQIKFPNKSVAYIDTEQAVDLYAAEHQYGVDMGTFPEGHKKFDYYPDPEFDPVPTLEDILNRVYNYAASGLYSLIVIDSIAASIPLWEQEQQDVTSAKRGGPSIQMSKAMKKVKAICARTGTIIWCVNQVRTTKVRTPQGEISKLEPGGGYALRYAATHRFNVNWVTKERDEDHQMLRVFAEKVKYGPPWRTIEVPFILGQGVNREADLIVCAERHGIIRKKGSWYEYDGSNIGQGLTSAAEALCQHTPLAKKIEKELYEVAFAKVQKETEDTT